MAEKSVEQLSFPSDYKVDSANIQPTQAGTDSPLETNGAASTLSERFVAG